MTEPLRIDDLEEFHFASRVPRRAVSPAVLDGIRRLDERTEIEPFLRAIIADYTETHHGSTEKADILTTQVTVAGEPRFAAFVNKGKSTPKVKSTLVSHQIARLQDIPNVTIMILLAVGEIQDDAKVDLTRAATNAHADYVFADAVDVARLFVAYRKVCGVDGTPFVDDRCPTCGRSREEPLKLLLDIFSAPEYEILSLHEPSTGVAKRYSAELLIPRHYTRPSVREVVREVVRQLRSADYYRSEITKSLFGQEEADVIFLFVYPSLDDRRNANWVCRVQWVNDNLDQRFRPLGIGGERIDGIAIQWNPNVDSRRATTVKITKRQWSDGVKSALPLIDQFTQRARDLFAARSGDELDQETFEQLMSSLEFQVRDLVRSHGLDGQPPIDCDEAYRTFSQLTTSVHNLFVPFATWAVKKRDWTYHHWHLSTTLELTERNKAAFRYEWAKVHGERSS